MLRQLRDVVRRPRLRRRARGVRVRGLVAGCESQSPRLRARGGGRGGDMGFGLVVGMNRHHPPDKRSEPQSAAGQTQ